MNNTHLPATAAASCYCYYQELCEGDLNSYLDKVKHVMYDVEGNPWIACLAPLIMDICRGMLYLHTCNVVHGGRRSVTLLWAHLATKYVHVGVVCGLGVFEGVHACWGCVWPGGV